MELVVIDGQIFTPEQAQVPVFDRGFLYGDSVYEVIRSYQGVLFLLEEHLERMYRSAGRIALDLGCPVASFNEQVREVYKRAERKGKDTYIRIIVTRGGGPITLDPGASTHCRTVIIVKDLPAIKPSWYTDGISVAIPEVQRNSRKAMDPNIKSGNYLNNVMAMAEAKKAGCDDAIMVNQQGYVAEATTSNAFMVVDDVIISPPDDADILWGITRRTLRQVAKDSGLAWQERFFSADELRGADEVFLTGSVKEVVPVTRVDGKLVGSGRPGPITTKLHQGYKTFIDNYVRAAK